MKKMVHLTDDIAIPARWLVYALVGAASMGIPPLLAYASLQHRVGDNTRRISVVERDARYAAEDAAWLRAQRDPHFHEVMKERRLRELADPVGRDE